MNIVDYQQFDFSGAVQDTTTWLLKKPNELSRGINLRFTEELGGFERRPGFEVVGNDFATNKAAQGGHFAKFTTGTVRMVAVNNPGNTATVIRTQDSNTGIWSDLPTISYPVNSIIFFLDYLDEVYISGFDPATGNPVQPYNVDKTLNVSSTRNLLNAPWPYFFAEYLGLLYAANVNVNGERKPDRVYKSSPPLGFVTSIQGTQNDVLTSVTYVDNVPTMTSPTTPFGVAAASSEVNVDCPAWKAFNDSSGAPSRWIPASNVNSWLRYDFGAGNAKVITAYSIIGERPGETANRGPKTWTLEGSNDAAAWTALDTRTNVATWNQNISEKRTYTMTNTTAYRYYRLNVASNHGADYIAVDELELLTSLQGPRSVEIKTDSVRYLKPGMSIDVYKAATETKLYDLTIADVDKVRNTLIVSPYTETVLPAAVNTTSNEITLSVASTFPTGTPIKMVSTTGLPAPLAADTLYYAIYVNTTVIKLATTLDNARVGNAIDITTQGSGTHYLRLSYQFADNDEIWLDNTKGRLNIFWNTDYPNKEATGEFLAIKPGTDSSNVISGIGKSSNRLFIWTKNSGTRWDGQNLVVFNNSVGCISQRSIANIDDDWLIWVDAKGNVRARNESSGQQEIISRQIYKRYLKGLTSDQLKAVNGAVVDQTYKLYLGTINGEHIRLVYDFDANTWSPERLGYPALIQGSDDKTGVLKPYFLSNNGKLYIDETGNKDADKTIAFEAGTGRDMLGTQRKKKFYGIQLFTENCNGLKFEAAVDGGQMKTIARIEGKSCFIQFPEQGESVLPEGIAFDWQIMGAIPSDPPRVQGAVIYYAVVENIPSEETSTVRL